MNENGVNVNIEDEEIKSPIYSTKFLMNKELFYDFNFVSYNRTKKVFLIFFCLVTCLIATNLLIGNYDTVVGFGPFISLSMLLIYLRTKKTIKIGYERVLISEGKEPTLRCELFEDKVISYNSELKREYFYHQITKFFETKNFFLLHLQHNLHVTIEKNNLNASVDEVKTFLINKCMLVKKKKFINCANDKKWTLRLLIAIIVVSVVGTAAGICLPRIFNKPVHFRELDSQTTQSDIVSIYGEPDRTNSFENMFIYTYDAEFLGIKGKLEFTGFDNTKALSVARFIVYYDDFESFEEYEKAIIKTHKHFNRVLSEYQSENSSDKTKVDICWYRNDGICIYKIYTSQKSDTYSMDDLRECAVFQFNNYSD